MTHTPVRSSRPDAPSTASTAPFSPDRPLPQYTRRAVVGVWAAAALPMAALAWLVAPALAGALPGPAPFAQSLLICLTAGLVWQSLVVVALVAREQGDLHWRTLRTALWLGAPRSPRTGRTGGRVWLVVVPLIAALYVEQLIPSLPHPVGRDFGALLESSAGHELLDGGWGWFALIVTMFLFNTVLGEELLFRGLLLPRMNGAFGDRDWLVNGLLFAAYHLHAPWTMPTVLLDTFVLAYPAKRYRSAWVSIAVHSAQSVFLTVLVLGLVL